jgi:hypothetical protein
MEDLAVADGELEQLLAAYSAGRISRRQLEKATGWWFGDILSALADRGAGVAACRHPRAFQ